MLCRPGRCAPVLKAAEGGRTVAGRVPVLPAGIHVGGDHLLPRKRGAHKAASTSSARQEGCMLEWEPTRAGWVVLARCMQSAGAGRQPGQPWGRASPMHACSASRSPSTTVVGIIHMCQAPAPQNRASSPILGWPAAKVAARALLAADGSVDQLGARCRPAKLGSRDRRKDANSMPCFSW